MRKKIIYLIFLMTSVTLANAQTYVNTAFRGGEKLVYTGSYFMSGLWTDLAQISMIIKPVKFKERNLYKINVVAQTYKEWDSYFRIRDLYQTWISPKTGKPYFFNRSVDEGGFKIKVKYTFLRKKNKAKFFMQVNNGNPRKQTVSITPHTFDMVSALYYVRNIDFSKDKIGALHPITVLIDGKLVKIYAKYRGIQTIKSSAYGGNVKCYKVGVILSQEKIMKNNPNNNVWLTADKNKVPVLIKATIPVGNIQIRLKSKSGLRN